MRDELKFDISRYHNLMGLHYIGLSGVVASYFDLSLEGRRDLVKFFLKGKFNKSALEGRSGYGRKVKTAYGTLHYIEGVPLFLTRKKKVYTLVEDEFLREYICMYYGSFLRDNEEPEDGRWGFIKKYAPPLDAPINRIVKQRDALARAFCGWSGCNVPIWGILEMKELTFTDGYRKIKVPHLIKFLEYFGGDRCNPSGRYRGYFFTKDFRMDFTKETKVKPQLEGSHLNPMRHIGRIDSGTMKTITGFYH